VVFFVKFLKLKPGGHGAMAKATVAQIFRAFQGANDQAREINSRLGRMWNEGKKLHQAREVLQELDRATNTFVILQLILEDCDFEIEIPPGSEEVVVEQIRLSTPIGGSGEESPPESLGWRH
jgi:hypothetical protein